MGINLSSMNGKNLPSRNHFEKLLSIVSIEGRSLEYGRYASNNQLALGVSIEWCNPRLRDSATLFFKSDTETFVFLSNPSQKIYDLNDKTLGVGKMSGR